MVAPNAPIQELVHGAHGRCAVGNNKIQNGCSPKDAELVLQSGSPHSQGIFVNTNAPAPTRVLEAFCVIMPLKVSGITWCLRTRARPGPEHDWSCCGPEISGPQHDHPGLSSDWSYCGPRYEFFRPDRLEICQTKSG